MGYTIRINFRNKIIIEVKRKCEEFLNAEFFKKISIIYTNVFDFICQFHFNFSAVISARSYYWF